MRALISLLVAVLPLAPHALASAPTPDERCRAAKVKATAAYMYSEGACFRRQILVPTYDRLACEAATREKLFDKFVKIESSGFCATTGDVTSYATPADQCVATFTTGQVTGEAKCAAAKTKALSKYFSTRVSCAATQVFLRDPFNVPVPYFQEYYGECLEPRGPLDFLRNALARADQRGTCSGDVDTFGPWSSLDCWRVLLNPSNSCFTDPGDGTILDTCTGRQWDKKTTTGGLHAANDVYPWACAKYYDGDYHYCQPDPAAAATCMAQALGDTAGCDVCATSCGETTVWSWINEVNAEGLGGHSDWRLPSIEELGSLTVPFDACIVGPCLDEAFLLPTGPYDEVDFASASGFSTALDPYFMALHLRAYQTDWFNAYAKGLFKHVFAVR